MSYNNYYNTKPIAYKFIKEYYHLDSVQSIYIDGTLITVFLFNDKDLDILPKKINEFSIHYRVIEDIKDEKEKERFLRSVAKKLFLECLTKYNIEGVGIHKDSLIIYLIDDLAEDEKRLPNIYDTVKVKVVVVGKMINLHPIHKYGSYLSLYNYGIEHPTKK